MILTNDDRQRSYWEENHSFRSYDRPVVRAFATQRIRFVSCFADRERRWILIHSMSFMRRLAEAADMDVEVSRVVGCIFPNKTPRFLAGLLERMP